jgi:TolB protein
MVDGAILFAALGAAAAGGALSASAAGPSGTLTFARGGALYDVVVGTTSPPRRLSGLMAAASEPAWAADGRRLAYVTGADGDAEIAVFDPVTRTSRRITSNTSQDTLPSWSPDGRMLAFASDRSGAFQVWVMRADGGTPRQVTTIGTPMHGAFYPAWAPDGSRIAFASGGPTPENQELYTVRPDGTGLRRLTFTAGDSETLGDDAAPAWSPDGRRLFFTSNRAGGLAIWQLRSDGRQQRRLLDLPRRDEGGPAVSSDGALLAFDARDPEGRVRLVVARSDGSEPRLSVPGESPAWRPTRSAGG